jgi:CMP/dCMP kinase
MRRITVAIDGPSGAGKSTVAKRLAQRLGYSLVDTGAIYRTVALLGLEHGLALDDEAALVAQARDLPISFQFSGQENRVFLAGRDISQDIRTPEVSRGASRVSSLPGVRRRSSGCSAGWGRGAAWCSRGAISAPSSARTPR